MGKHAPKELEARGKALWRDLGLELDTAAGALAYEACRIVDRLVELHRRVETDPDAQVRDAAATKFQVADVLDTEDDREIHINVNVTPILGEIRNQQNTLRQTLLSVVKLVAEADEAGDGDAPAQRPAAKKAADSTVDEFTRRRRGRDVS